MYMHGRLTILGSLLLALLSVAITGHGQSLGCGDFEHHYGPFDYRTATKKQRDLVERYHFTQDVATLKKGASTTKIAGDISYTLLAFPNHPRALMAMSDLARRQHTRKPDGATYDVDCWFERAIRFRPDDPMVRYVLGISKLKDGVASEAVKQLDIAEKALPDDPMVHYNLGLAYLDLKDYDKARAEAQKAYDLGAQLPGLRELLKKAGKW
jgi:tetratricopeptide (TPR) repeat protein